MLCWSKLCCALLLLLPCSYVVWWLLMCWPAQEQQTKEKKKLRFMQKYWHKGEAGKEGREGNGQAPNTGHLAPGSAGVAGVEGPGFTWNARPDGLGWHAAAYASELFVHTFPHFCRHSLFVKS